MCGIVGQYGAPDGDLLRRMNDIIRHRGPDDGGEYLDGSVGLGNRRLSVIDVSGGHQPMTNEDESVFVVYNGEIYNHDELRRDLTARGHTFVSRCDTEVLVHGYEDDGPDFVHRLQGMFAFAVWDRKRRRLVLARDRIGIKPLYYSELSGGRLAFGSELRSLLVHPDVDSSLNLRALGRYLTFGYVPPPETIHSGVKALLPGHRLILEEGGVPRVERYWDVAVEPEQDRGLAHYKEEFRELFRDAVRSRLEADVPLGAFLSGGIDSSSVVGEMSRLGANPVRTFTIGFADTGWRFDETEDARIVARHFGTEHKEWMLTEAEVIAAIPELIDHQEQPCATGISAYFVSQLARRDVTVSLAGIGGDELFAGYPRHAGMKMLRAYRTLPRLLRERLLRPMVEALPGSVGGVNLVRRAQLLVRSAERDEVGRYLAWSAAVAEEELGELLLPDVHEATGNGREILQPYLDRTEGRPFRDRVLDLDLKTYLPFDLLELTDKLSMAHSLEVRVPYCDHRLVEFAARLPYRHKLRGLTGKYLVRQALSSDLPARVFQKGKQGFAIPMGLWIQGGLQETIRDCLSPDTIANRGLLQPARVGRMLEEHLSGTRDWTYRLWALAALELWMRRAGRGQPAACASGGGVE